MYPYVIHGIPRQRAITRSPSSRSTFMLTTLAISSHNPYLPYNNLDLPCSLFGQLPLHCPTPLPKSSSPPLRHSFSGAGTDSSPSPHSSPNLTLCPSAFKLHRESSYPAVSPSGRDSKISQRSWPVMQPFHAATGHTVLYPRTPT